ncbi:MAG: hypothetical protein KAG10_07450 [Methylococcales bacterium]|nr:hypothetical protein [Methylococcales bacterium]MCK5925711.1 hypothetical protein [Methylococcales bacterium]
MAKEKKEKDNFFKIVGAIAVITITLVVILKQREVEHLTPQSAGQSQEQVLERNHPPGNTFTE